MGAAEKMVLWDSWLRGESPKAIGRAFGKPSSVFIASWPPRCCVDRLRPPSNSGQTRVRLACPRSAINDHCSMSEGFDHTHFHDARATVEEPSTASLTDIRLAVANKPGSPDSR